MYDLSQISKTNYDEIFDDIIKRQPELRQLIEYIRQISNVERSFVLAKDKLKKLLIETEPDGEKIVQTIYLLLTNRYMRVSVNIAYKFSLEHESPLDEMIQYALEELLVSIVYYVEKNIKCILNGIYLNDTYGDTFGNLYTYLHQRTIRRLELEKFNLLGIPSEKQIDSILKSKEKNLQEHTKYIENKEYILKAEESISILEEKILFLQNQLKALNDLALNLEMDYRNAFEKILLEQKKWYIFYDFSELKECAKIALNKYKQILTQFNMTEIGFIRKISNSERIYTSHDIYNVSEYLINILNESIYKLIDTTNEKIFNYECRIEDIRENVILKEREQVNKISTLMGEITLYTQLLLPAYSIEKIIENDQEVELGMCDESLESIVSHNLLKEQLISVLCTLTPREEKVLRLRFGFDDESARTLEEVGKEFNVNRERIRQIEAKALRKLRHPSRSKKLKDYLY